MSKLSGELKAVWNGIQLILSEKEYDIAMSHVEHMRQVAVDKKYYEDSEVGDEDEDFIEPDEPEEWKLSDTLYEVLRKARTQKDWDPGFFSETAAYTLPPPRDFRIVVLLLMYR